MDAPTTLAEAAARIAALESALRAARREHWHSDDQYESCAASDTARLYGLGGPCDCGASEHNAAIDEVLAGSGGVTLEAVARAALDEAAEVVQNWPHVAGIVRAIDPAAIVAKVRR